MVRFAAVLILAACGGSTPAPAPSSTPPATAAAPPAPAADAEAARKQRLHDVWSGFRDEMCACKDKACADHVVKKIGEWSDREARRSPDGTITPDYELVRFVRPLIECQMNLMPPPPTPEPLEGDS